MSAKMGVREGSCFVLVLADLHGMMHDRKALVLDTLFLFMA
jgi:hypothetical protein